MVLAGQLSSLKLEVLRGFYSAQDIQECNVGEYLGLKALEPKCRGLLGHYRLAEQITWH